MTPAVIAGATRYLGAPVDWKPEEHGECGHLAIRDHTAQGGLNMMVSAWIPTPEEIAAIIGGAPIKLWVVGTAHPAVSLTVGELPA